MNQSSAPPTASPWHTTTPGDQHIPRFVTYTSPVSVTPGGSVRATTLPLNLIALIISYLDDVGDVARVTRTSRLLYYMTLPQLYRSVNLHSYPDIRYINGRPEGFGSGSPFLMALNGLVTQSHAGMVHRFRIWGQWNELGVEDFARGRVPDNSMMLNTLLRAAVDRMAKLQSFSWELDCKPLKTLYQGLGAHHTLTSLTLKFPQSRLPRPSVIIPPMANLRVFKALDIDPLCYPDDFSVMLLHSKKLEDLRIHFSPRMRREAESSLNLDTYFGRCFAAGYKLPLKHLGIQNYYGPKSQNLSRIVDDKTCLSICTLDIIGGISGNVMNKFYDDTWRNILDMEPKQKISRTNEPAEQHITLLSKWKGLEQFYMVGSRASRAHDSVSPQAFTPTETPPDQRTLGKEYVYALTRYHGSTLTHILLADQWLLDDGDISELVLHCPNLEQLALATHSPALESLQLIIPHLRKLHSLRFLGADDFRTDADRLGHQLGKMRSNALRYVGLGDRILRLEGSFQDPGGSWKTDAKEVQYDDVKHLGIWRLDNLDISADPVAPFSP